MIQKAFGEIGQRGGFCEKAKGLRETLRGGEKRRGLLKGFLQRH